MTGTGQISASIRAKGEKLAPLSERLAKIGLTRDWDFVLHLPLRYEDETAVIPIDTLHPGMTAQIQATVIDSRLVKTPRGPQLNATVQDESGTLSLRFIHFYPSTHKQLAVDKTVRLYGEVRTAFGGGLEIIHPRIKAALNELSELPKALTPIYPAGEGIQQRWLRNRISRALLDVDIRDLIPSEITARLGLPPLKEAIYYLHNPPPDANLISLQDRSHPAWQRLKFDELLAQQITLRESRFLTSQGKALSLKPTVNATLVERLKTALPFTLTNAQEKVWREISDDLENEIPMNRLVQGDVGSGKTVIAALAAARAIESGTQAALMAPTEILAEQHFEHIVEWLTPLGVKIAWLTGKQKATARRENLALIASGEASIVVGTHALIQDNVVFHNLALAIVDEQHRFGVAQRLKLRASDASEIRPHLLMLSATPIPRTLAMSYLADLDVSVIDELPPGRTPITTKTVRIDRRNEVVSVVRGVIQEGRQAYWVCPLINENEDLDLTAATDCQASLQIMLPDTRVGLLHGEMSSQEKAAVMTAFSNGEIDLLVATTVIEVGVDVSNATLMVIEHAERFGLAQLHQLRGRVGRGSARSACILLYDTNLSQNGRERLKVIRETTDGFEIARKDLEIRGPGEFLGERQSGLPMLRFANLEDDEALLESARRVAESWLRQNRESALQHARRWFSAKAGFLSA